MSLSLDLRVRVASLQLANPILAASGAFGYGLEFAHLVHLGALGGLVTKGLSAQPMPGAPSPRLAETAAGMLNAVGLQNIGVRAFIAEKLPQLRSCETAIVANIFGSTFREYLEVIEALEQAEGLAAYELNISCPNTDAGGREFGLEPAVTAELVRAARRTARRPLWVKLSPNVTDIVPLAKAAEDAGADALTIANTYPGMAVDIRTRRSRLGRLFGGLSGPAVKPMALKLVYEACRAVQIPVLGLGGIETPEDVLEYILVGATAVQVGTAHFVNPAICQELVKGVHDLMSRINLRNINDLRGQLRA
ncbi:MAG TPA: dihydroorotate dehydrogenase [Candidatus Acidoferrales bacterium]|nr:dihydroorotate dehydrogenase [Candidatus Acidoferrales bacterium]